MLFRKAPLVAIIYGLVWPAVHTFPFRGRGWRNRGRNNTTNGTTCVDGDDDSSSVEVLPEVSCGCSLGRSRDTVILRPHPRRLNASSTACASTAPRSPVRSVMPLLSYSRASGLRRGAHRHTHTRTRTCTRTRTHTRAPTHAHAHTRTRIRTRTRTRTRSRTRTRTRTRTLPTHRDVREEESVSRTNYFDHEGKADTRYDWIYQRVLDCAGRKLGVSAELWGFEIGAGGAGGGDNVTAAEEVRRFAAEHVDFILVGV